MDHGTMGILLAFVFLLIVGVIIIVVIWQVFGNQRARAALTRDEAYQKLAQQATEAQQATAEDLARLQERVASIEKLLREVE